MPTTADASPGSAAGASPLRAATAIIGGSGLYHLQEAAAPCHAIVTPYGEQPVSLYLEQGAAGPFWFLPRHGKSHDVAPHEINYRANLWALYQQGVRQVFAINAVGGIADGLEPGALVVPDQLIDYSWGREHSYFSGKHSFEAHIDFTEPYDAGLRALLLQAGAACHTSLRTQGVYACTQGPRLETAAEIRRLARDGCDIVGMTGMPEAALARELGMAYASVALVVNRAAGLGDGHITMDAIRTSLDSGMTAVRRLLCEVLLLQKSVADSVSSRGGNT